VPRHPLIVTYLERLERMSDHLPAERRQALVKRVDDWLGEALGPQPTLGEVRSVLAGLGTPEELVAVEDPRPAAPPAPVPAEPARPTAGALEVAAIVLLAVGGLLAGIGWFIGVVLLWASPVWKPRDKLIGTFLWPGGFFTSIYWCAQLWEPPPTNDGLALAATAAVLGVPALTAWHLARRTRP